MRYTYSFTGSSTGKRMAKIADLAALVAAVREGAKYRHLDVGLVEAVAAAEAAKGRNFTAQVL